MSRPELWFEEADDAPLPDGNPAGKAWSVSPANRLLVASPAGAPARTIAVADRTAGVARTTPTEIIAGGARRLRTVSPFDEESEHGTLAFAQLADDETTTPTPWSLAPDRPTAGSTGVGRPWRPEESAESPLARRLAVLLRPSIELLLTAAGPMEWPQPLLPYQVRGVRELIERSALLLADDMGLGKTVQAAAAMRILFVLRRIESALIVVPAALLTQWRGELRRWAPELRISTVHGAPGDRGWQWRAPAHVYLTTYETLRTDADPADERSPAAREWDLVVLDEAQRIKNPAAEISRACKGLRRRRQWALTGTPLENTPEDLISLLDFVEPGQGRGLSRFMATAGLRELLARVQLRRRKRDVLTDLPPKRISQIVLPLTPHQRESYDRAERDGIIELRALGDRLEIEHVLDLILRLRQICNVCPTSGESSKLNDLRERLAILRAEGHKALIFTQFANVSYGARGIAARLGPSALAYTGDLDQAARDAVLHRFRTEPESQALVLSLRAGGQGLNLQEASYVFHVDRWWNPATAAQAEARSHRLGQRRPVNVYVYVSENTIEERIERLLRQKQILFDEVVEGVSLAPAVGVPDREVFALLGLATTTRDGDPAATIDYAGLSDLALADQIRRWFRRQGWRVEPPPPGLLGEAGFIATHDQASGDAVELIGRCWSSAIPFHVDTIRELHAIVAARPGSKGVLICPGGTTSELSIFSAERDIDVWDAALLNEIGVPAGDEP